MKVITPRRKVLSWLVAGCITPLVQACGGGNSGSDDTAESARQTKANPTKPSSPGKKKVSLTITSPTAGQTVSGTINVTGTDGGATVTASDGSTALGSASVSAQAYSISVDTTKMPNGTQTITVGDGTSTATVSVNVSNSGIAANAFTVSSPASGSAEGTTFTMSGTAGSNWVNVAVYDSGGNKVGADVTPSGGAWSTTINMGSETGSQTLTAMAFSVPPGQSGGTSASVTETYTIGTGGGATLAVTAPANNSNSAAPVSVSGTTNQPTVTVSNALTASGGAFSGSLTLAAGTYALTFAAGAATPVTVNVTVPASGGGTSPHFYGVNAHYNEGGIYATNVAQQVKDMQAMGIKTVRQDCGSTSDTATLAGLISAFSPIVIQPIFNVYPTTTNETTAYNQFYAYGQTVAQQLAGKVPVIEMMNEPEVQYFNNGTPAANGQSITNWSADNSQWPAFRGAVRGFYAGFRSVDTTKQTLITSPSVTWLHYGILQGLWTGAGPDGSTGNPTASWDITNQHWYYNFGDIKTAGGVNTLAQLQSMFGVPIILSEIGVNTSISQSAYDSYITSALTEYQAAAATYNIVGIDWYMLYTSTESPDMGLYSSPGTVNAARASTMASCISAHPMS
jgi:hypothetical protein